MLVMPCDNDQQKTGHEPNTVGLTNIFKLQQLLYAHVAFSHIDVTKHNFSPSSRTPENKHLALTTNT